MSNCESPLPNLTPVRLTITLALELFPAATHSSSTFRADPIENAGDHVCSRFDRTQSHKPHNITSRITSNNQSLRMPFRRRSAAGFCHVPYVSECHLQCCNCISSSKTGDRTLIFRFKRQKLVSALMSLSYESQHQSSMWQFAKSGSRLRSPASIEHSFHCEGVLLSALFHATFCTDCSRGRPDDSRRR